MRNVNAIRNGRVLIKEFIAFNEQEISVLRSPVLSFYSHVVVIVRPPAETVELPSLHFFSVLTTETISGIYSAPSPEYLVVQVHSLLQLANVSIRIPLAINKSFFIFKN